MERYLNGLQIKRIEPNFFISRPYLEYAGVQEQNSDGYLWLSTPDTECLFPPIDIYYRDVYKPPVKTIWADFNDTPPAGYTAGRFLDWEYLFNPDHFKTMAGGDWTSFRKNCRKWPKRNFRWCYISAHNKLHDIDRLLYSWMSCHERDAEDADLLIQFCYSENKDVNRGYLYQGDALIGINIWDVNWQYVNYRYCLAKPGEPFLDEFLRWLFYRRDMEASQLLVNDGGTLGRESLEKFKDKLNPVRKRKIFSWVTE